MFRLPFISMFASTLVALTTCSVHADNRGPVEWTIVASYPIPEGASGLAWDGTNLYCGIYGADG